MARSFCIPSLVFAFIGAVLLLLSTISTPTTFSTDTGLEVVRVSGLDRNGVSIIDASNGANPDRVLQSIRYGTWGWCSKAVNQSDYSYCNKVSHGWEARLNLTGDNPDAAYQDTLIKSSWTRGLAVNVAAFVVAGIGFILTWFPHLTVQLIAFVVQLISTLLALIAFIIELVLFIYVRNRIHRLNDDATVMPGVSFYTTLIAIPILFIASITACCGHRKDKRGTASSGNGFYSTGKFANADTDFNTATSETKGNSFPMKASRQRVLDAFHGKDKSTVSEANTATAV